MDAQNRPMPSRRNQEIHTGNMEVGQKPDVDLGFGAEIAHGESLADVSGDIQSGKDHITKLAFNEEPITIRIEENTRSDNPETHAPCYVNGKAAEILVEGKWLPSGFLPIGVVLTTKRKYAEVLMRSKSDNVRTLHEDVGAKSIDNRMRRTTASNYPISIIEDRNPLGVEWATRIIRGL